MSVLILGCGFTGKRVARRLRDQGIPVFATSRTPESITEPGIVGIPLQHVPRILEPGMRVVHSIPPQGAAGVKDLLGHLPGRIVYISSTAVYGDAGVVDHTTPVGPEAAQGRERLAGEQEIAQGPWQTLILRAAAIYGPGRGVQESLPRAAYYPGENFVSRIHVDDLAEHVIAALHSDLTGAFPVADEEPCTSREIAEFCAAYLGLPADILDQAREHRTGRILTNRRVNGSEVRRLLGISLRYPSYRTGVPACLPAK